MMLQKLFAITQDWEMEAEIAKRDGKPEVATAIRYLLKDLYAIMPLGELDRLRKEAEMKEPEPYIRKKITGDHRF